MGTDIHPVVQVRTPSGWRTVQTRNEFERPNPWMIGGCRPLAPGEVDMPKALRARVYDVFAILADVRNGRGCAGIKTGDGWPSIAPARGIPDDAGLSENDSDLGDHSFSWVTLRELLDFDWCGIRTTQCGVLSAAQYDEWATRYGDGGWEARRAPSEYSGAISGPDVITVLEAEYVEGAIPAPMRVYILASWPARAIEACSDFYECALPWLTALGAPDDVRLVFGFDS